MYKYFNIIISNDIGSYTLKYELEDHRPAQTWAEIMSRMPVSYLRPNKDPWMGVVKSLDSMINDLSELVKDLNQWMPEPIELDWDRTDHQLMVNKYHTHFPEHEADQDPIHRKQLTRYNDIIHDIENQTRVTSNSLYLLICPDPPIGLSYQHRKPLELEDYKFFGTDFKFGGLYMGYSHIGRHPIELYHANDRNVPADQILPQNVIGPIHCLYFHDYKIDMEKFTSFYQDSRIPWPYSLDDPRLAVGMISMGTLKTVNNKVLDNTRVLEIVESCNKIVFWNVE
jgi:hypothetical protein